MADDLLSMEARLKDYVSQNLRTIENQLRHFSDIQERESRRQRQSTDNLRRSTNDLTKSYTGLVSSARTAIQAAGGFIIYNQVRNYLRSATEASKEQIEADTKLQQVLLSTAGAAGVTFNEMSKLADELQGVTTSSDEVIQRGQSMLLTFTNISKEILPATTETMLNLSVAMRTDVQNAAIQLGKALNDPILGVTALRRVGVQLSEQQEAQIKQFVRMNDIVSAQRIILDELQIEFGGLARAMAQTDSGRQEQLNNILSDQSEILGRELIPLQNEFKNLLVAVGTIGVAPLAGLIKGLTIELKLLSGATLESVRTTEFLREAMLRTEDEAIDAIVNKIEELKVKYNEYSTQLETARNEQATWASGATTSFNAQRTGIGSLEKQVESYEKQIIEAQAALDSLISRPPPEAKKFTGGGLSEEEQNKQHDQQRKLYEQFRKLTTDWGEEAAKLEWDNRQNQLRIQQYIGNLEIDALTEKNETALEVQRSYAEEMNYLLETANNDSLQGRLANIQNHIESELTLWNYYRETNLISDQQYEQLKTELVRQGHEERLQLIQQEATATASNLNSMLGSWRSYLSTKRNAEYQAEVVKIKNMNLSAAQEKKLLKEAAQQNREAAKKEQNLATIQAIINGALAFTKALSSSGPPLNFINAGLVAAATAFQVATIQSQKLARGGVVNTLLGEQGMELVERPSYHQLPVGTRVYNNTETKKMLGGNSIVIHLPPGETVDDRTALRIENAAQWIGDVLETAQSQGRLDRYHSMAEVG